MIKRFNRYEIKYLLRVADMFNIVDELGRFMRSDPNAVSRGGYRVSSLYYDSPDLECYRSKIDGIKFRRKIRIRKYDDAVANNVFLEIKQRMNKTVQKRRTPLPLNEAYAICDGDDIHPSDNEDAVLSEVRFLKRSLQLRRTCVIRYHRRAFQGGRYEPGLRITFDTNLRYRIHALDLDCSSPGRFFIPPDLCVMEVKANERVPLWLTSLLASHQCNLSRVSKYCLGVAKGLEHLRQRRLVASG